MAVAPEGALVLAGNAACPVQAMRCERFAYGFQFHTEVMPQTVPDWRQIPAYRASLESALGPRRAQELETLVARKLDAFRSTAQRLDDNLEALMAGLTR